MQRGQDRSVMRQIGCNEKERETRVVKRSQRGHAIVKLQVEEAVLASFLLLCIEKSRCRCHRRRETCGPFRDKVSSSTCSLLSSINI